MKKERDRISRNDTIPFRSAKEIRAFAEKIAISNLRDEILKSARRGDFSLSIYSFSISQDLIDMLKEYGYQVEPKAGTDEPKMLEISWE